MLSRLNHLASTSCVAASLACALATSLLLCACAQDDSSVPHPNNREAGLPETGDEASICVAATCKSLGANCGTAPDGCGGVLSCGTCVSGQFCGGAGPNRCGSQPCSPKTCEASGAECGIASDGCEATSNCGPCPAGSSCNSANRCSCKPATCASLGLACGTQASGCGGEIDCGPCPQGSVCDKGKCVGCSSAWRTSGLAHSVAFDPKRSYLYSYLPVDGGVAFATVDSCTGAVVGSRTPAPSAVGLNPLLTINELSLLGDYVYTRGACQEAAGPLESCVFRYNAVTNTVDARGVIGLNSTEDDIWYTTVSGSGKVFASGTYAAGKLARIVPLEPDGTNCGGAAVDAGQKGAAIGAQDDDVFQVVYTGVPGELRVLRYSASSCSTAGSCGCSPTAVYPVLALPIADLSPSPTTFKVAVHSGYAYVVGLQVNSSSSGSVGFVVAFDLGEQKWSPVYVYAPSNGSLVDGLVRSAVTPDGKLLYVVGGKGYGSATPAGVLLRFDLPFPKSGSLVPNGEITVPGLSTVWDIVVSDSAVFLAGDSVEGTGGSLAKCLSNLACKE